MSQERQPIFRGKVRKIVAGVATAGALAGSGIGLAGCDSRENGFRDDTRASKSAISQLVSNPEQHLGETIALKDIYIDALSREDVKSASAAGTHQRYDYYISVYEKPNLGESIDAEEIVDADDQRKVKDEIPKGPNDYDEVVGTWAQKKDNNDQPIPGKYTLLLRSAKPTPDDDGPAGGIPGFAPGVPY